MIQHILTALLGVAILQTATFVVALRRGRVDVVDVAWGLSAVAIVIALQLRSPTSAISVLLVQTLVSIWGLRLAWHIWRRMLHSNEQDPRYTTLTARWPRRYYNLQIYLKIFLLQSLLATIVNLPVIVVHYYRPDFQPLILVGLLLWVVGFVFESVADMQLRQFLRSSDGKILMQTGLWRYSRHPNYFGEIVMWWGVAVTSWVTPLWWVGCIGALVITLLLCFVSGVPLAEARAGRKNGWDDYKKRTSVLVLWPPKK